MDLSRRRRNGFKEKDAAYLKNTLDTLKTKTPVVPLKGKNCVFAEPKLIAEMEFAAGPTTVICGMNLIEAFGEFRIMPRFMR